MDIRVEINEGANYGTVHPSTLWTAIDEDTYDCDCDQDGFFSTSPVGYGRTPLDAIVDLLDQMEDA